MANYAVEDWSSVIDDMVVVLAALEVKLETIDSGKTIRGMGVIGQPSRKVQAYLVYDT